MSDQQEHEPQSVHRLGFHMGAELCRAANTYRTLQQAIIEAIQNAVDAGAKTVYVGIYIGRGDRERQVIVLDDGEGVSLETFRVALGTIGRSIKTRRGFLGQFGLGFLAPLNKCIRYIFASQHIDANVAYIWRFNGEEIRQSHEAPEIEPERSAALPAIPTPFLDGSSRLCATWRTYVLLDGVTQDQAVAAIDLDAFEAQVRTSLGPGMRRRGTTLHVELIQGRRIQRRSIEPADFTGEPLPVVTTHDHDCGRVRFEFYRAPKTDGERRGRVVVQADDDDRHGYPVSWHDFYVQALGSGWLALVKPAFDALRSGYFEGRIYAERIELDVERTRFILSDALKALYLVIDRWYVEHGRAYLEDEAEIRRDERYKRLGELSLGRLLGALASETTLLPIARRLAGVLPVPKPRRSTSRERNVREEGTSPQATLPGTQQPRQPKRVEVRVVEPGRTKRSARFALTFAYDVLHGSMRLWEFDPETGVLTFNVRHHAWVRVDETDGRHTLRNDRQIMKLQEWLAMEVLVLLTHYNDPDFNFDDDRRVIDEKVDIYLALFVLGQRGRDTLPE